jgi:hypothetical protein
VATRTGVGGGTHRQWGKTGGWLAAVFARCTCKILFPGLSSLNIWHIFLFQAIKLMLRKIDMRKKSMERKDGARFFLSSTQIPR